MKIKNLLPRFVVVLALIVAFASCEEDFNTIGTNIIDQNADIKPDSFPVLSYSRKLLPVQTNGLPVYRLGVYNDPVYGKVTSNFLGQVTLQNANPMFGENPELYSVILSIPFFNQSVQDGDDTTFTLDSVYGDSPIRISIFESNFLLRDLDPDTGFEDPQQYYSNQRSTFESNLISPNVGVETSLFTVVDDFVPVADESEIIVPYEALIDNVPETMMDTITVQPGLTVELPLAFFKERIIDMEGTQELDNNNNFREYFRGMYFKVDEVGGGDNSFLFNADGANITLRYTNESTTITNGDTLVNTNLNNLVLDFGGINVNTIDNQLPADIEGALMNPDTENGEETLYIQGGEGIVTIVELFPGLDEDMNGVSDVLDELRRDELLINEANLIFYVDQDKVTGGAAEPDRVIIFDAENATFLEQDRFFDITATEAAATALNIHLGPLERGSDENGEFYKIRVTNHVSNLINRDSTNVALGLLVSQNVLVTDFQDLENTQSPGLESIPASSIIARQGTVLHGNLSPVPAKRLQLRIFYTKPE